MGGRRGIITRKPYKFIASKPIGATPGSVPGSCPKMFSQNQHYPKSAISVMMITAYIFEQMSLRFEGAMGFHCN